jgi:predicted DNA binding CopG/RHH family protein
MKKEKEFNFKEAKRGARLSSEGTKIAVTVRLDHPVLLWLRQEAEAKGIPYQTYLNSLLTEAMKRPSAQEELIRKIVRDEMAKKTG